MPFTSKPISINDIFGEDSKYVKRYQLVETKEDLLTLSCAWKRRREEKPAPIAPYTGLLDTALFKSVVEEDRILSAQIKDYYSKKIMIWKLKNQPLTKFREDLNNFIHSDMKKFQEEVLGMVFHLPTFYANDVKFDEMARDMELTIDSSNSDVYTKTLSLRQTFTVKRRGMKSIQYWFADETNHMVNINVSGENPLLRVWNSVVQKPVKINGIWTRKTRDSYQYYVANKFDIEL